MTPRKKKALTQREMDALDALVGKSKSKKLIPKDVVKAARNKSHPLHGRFEWDVKKAAWSYWVEQARDIIQIYVTVVNGDSNPVHAFVALKSSEEGYTPIRQALSSKETLAELKSMFGNDLLAVLKRYEYLRGSMRKEFAAVEKIAAGLERNG